MRFIKQHLLSEHFIIKVIGHDVKWNNWQRNVSGISGKDNLQYLDDRVLAFPKLQLLWVVLDLQWSLSMECGPGVNHDRIIGSPDQIDE